jgi:hypothetical protein
VPPALVCSRTEEGMYIFHRYANRRGAESAKSLRSSLLALLAPRYLRVFEEHATTRLTEERQLSKDEPQKSTSWLTALKKLNIGIPSAAELKLAKRGA